MARIHRNPEAERRIQDRIIARMAAGYQKRIRRELSRQAKDAAAAYERGASISAAVQGSSGRLEKLIASMYEDAYATMAARTDKQIASAVKGYRPTERKDIAQSPLFASALRAFIKAWTARKVVQINRTTEQQIAAEVQRSIEQGRDLTETAAAIAGIGRRLAGYRSEVIARTEIHSACMAGSLEAAKQSQVVRMKEWIPANDSRTRDGDNSDFDHQNVESVPIGEKFDVSGEMLDRPGDFAGSAGNVINCRCALTYTTID
jgi:hypothetical protein